MFGLLSGGIVAEIIFVKLNIIIWYALKIENQILWSVGLEHKKSLAIYGNYDVRNVIDY